MSRKPRVGALLMAAGLSRRMGRQKLLLPIDGEAMVAASHRLLAEAGLPILVVTGADAADVQAAIPEGRFIFARDHAHGLAHSLRAGLSAIPAEWDAVLVHLGDMPFVSPTTFRLLASRLELGAPAVVPVHQGVRGNPAGFARTAISRLLMLEGDRGARAMLDALEVEEVDVDDPGVLRDVDRPEDLP